MTDHEAMGRTDGPETAEPVPPTPAIAKPAAKPTAKPAAKAAAKTAAKPAAKPAGRTRAPKAGASKG